MQDDVEFHVDDGVTLDCSARDFMELYTLILEHVPEMAEVIQENSEHDIQYIQINATPNPQHPAVSLACCLLVIVMVLFLSFAVYGFAIATGLAKP